MRKIISILLVLQLFAVPGAVFAQQTGVNSTSSNPVDSAMLASGGTTSTGKVAVISNESIDTANIESTGTLNVKNIKYSLQGSLKPSAYKIDYVKPFNPASLQGKMVRKSTSYLPPTYKEGDSRNFWVSNLTSGTYSQIPGTLAYTGTKVNVWVNDNQISTTDAAKLGQEFDHNIYPTITNTFGPESDVNHDGKIDIFCYDIQDGYSSSGAYVAGYFDPNDLTNNTYSNQEEIFYIDTNPTMGSGSTKDVTQVYSTLAHEFQHMVSANQNILIEKGSSMDTWLDEGLSMAAEQIYDKHGLSDRLDYYNNSTAIQNGQSLLYWDDSGDVLSNYALSYLFVQYVKIQAGKGDQIFREILQDPHNDYRAIEDIAKKYIDSNMTFEKLMTDFRIALLLKQPTGLYGFHGDPFFDGIQDKVFTGNSTDLLGGGAVVTNFDGLSVPADKGPDVSYHVFDLSGGGQMAPGSPSVDPVGDADTQITGTADTSTSTVYAMVGQTEIGRGSNVSGAFTIPITKQPAGTIIQVFAEDAAGHSSAATSVTVKDMTAPLPPTVYPVGDQDTVVTGQAEAGAFVDVETNGSIIGLDTAGTDGKFTVTIPVQQAGTSLEIYATDLAGNTSAPVSVVVKGDALHGWVNENGSWYYYDLQTGVMKTGWLKLRTIWYYFDGNGAMKTGWLKSGTSWYYFDGSGTMKTGWLKSGTRWYYFNGNGTMVSGWLKSGTTWYYFNGSGKMINGWLKLGMSWYYFDSSGKMKTGWVTISGKRDYFNSQGIWVK